MCIKLAVLSSFSWSWSSCSHHCSISDDLEWFWVLPAPLVGHKASYGCYAPDHLLPARAWSHQIGCRGIGLLHSPDLATSLGLKCRAEPGVHHFHTLQFRVRWRELLKDCQVLHMEKKQVKAWIVQEVTVMKSQRSYCMTRKGVNQTVSSSNLTWLLIKDIYIHEKHELHKIASRFHGTSPFPPRLNLAWFWGVLS